MLLYLCDQQLYVLFKAVQESLQGASVGSAALPSPNFWQSSVFVLNLSQDLKKVQKSKNFLEIDSVVPCPQTSCRHNKAKLMHPMIQNKQKKISKSLLT